MPGATLGLSQDLTEPLLPQAFDLPLLVILVTEHCLLCILIGMTQVNFFTLGS